MASAKYPPASLITIGLVVLNFMAFVVLLGGAAGLQHDANTVVGLLNQVNTLPGSVLSFGDLQPQSTNSNFISYEWFKAVFQVVTLLFTLGVLAAGQIYRFRLALVGLYAALAVLFSDASQTFYYLFLQTKDNPLVPSKVKKEIQVYWSGCIMSATLNYLTIITLGSGLDHMSHRSTAAATTATGMKDSNGAATHPAV